MRVIKSTLFLFGLIFSLQAQAELVSPGPVDTSILGAKKLNLAKSAFDYDRENCLDSAVAVADDIADGSCTAQAPILLPSGTTIQKITLTVAASDGEEILAYVRGVDLTDGSTSTSLALLRVTSSTSGIKMKTVTLGFGSITMDSNTAYSIDVVLEDNGNASDDYPRVYGASVTYR